MLNIIDNGRYLNGVILSSERLGLSASSRGARQMAAVVGLFGVGEGFFA